MGSLRSRAGEFSDQFGFVFVVRCAVFPKYIVKPGVGLFRVRFLPRMPGIDRLGAPVDQSPVDSADVLLFEIRHDGFEGAAGTARHVFGADDRPAGFL